MKSRSKSFRKNPQTHKLKSKNYFVYSIEELHRIKKIRQKSSTAELEVEHCIPPELVSARDGSQSNVHYDREFRHNDRRTKSQTNRNNSDSNIFLPKFSHDNTPQVKFSSHSNSSLSMGVDIIHLTLDLQEEVKLNETENAWKPKTLQVPMDENSGATDEEELFRKVRSILNKLTPDNCHKLTEDLKGFSINTPSKLQGVIRLIFEKAVSEPNFSTAYALVCKTLGHMTVVDADSNQTFVFQKVLVCHCQTEFEKIADDTRKTKQDKCEEIDTPDEIERKLRHRSIGAIRFIGEVFKLGMLTAKIMLGCIQLLLVTKQEETLECLAKLLTTIGELLDKHHNLDMYFSQIDDLVQNYKKHNVSNRIRFMLLDLCDLRRDNWVPRRKNEINPQKMDVIQKQIEMEEQNSKYINFHLQLCKEIGGFYSSTSSNDGPVSVGGGGGGGGIRSGGGSYGGSGGNWSTQSARRNKPVSVSSFDMRKFTSKLNIDSNTQLGRPALFKWKTQSSNNNTNQSIGGGGNPQNNKFSPLLGLEASSSTSSIPEDE